MWADNFGFCTSDFSEDLLRQLKEELHADGFKCYETAVGGSGYGVVSIPPSGSLNIQHIQSEGGAESDIVPVRVQLEKAPIHDLVNWVNQVGNMIFP